MAESASGAAVGDIAGLPSSHVCCSPGEIQHTLQHCSALVLYMKSTPDLSTLDQLTSPTKDAARREFNLRKTFADKTPIGSSSTSSSLPALTSSESGSTEVMNPGEQRELANTTPPNPPITNQAHQSTMST